MFRYAVVNLRKKLCVTRRFDNPVLAVNSILACVEVSPPIPVLYHDLPSLSEHCHWNEVARSASMAKNAVDPAAVVQSSGWELMAYRATRTRRAGSLARVLLFGNETRPR